MGGVPLRPRWFESPLVERSVQYVRERFFKGGSFSSFSHLREEAARWCRDVAGHRVHGATRQQPLVVFQDEERHALAPWGGEPYEVTHWRTAKVHADHHVACQYALYSVPAALCPPGQQVEIGLGSKLVRIYHRGRLIKLHPRPPRGGRSTDSEDYPPELTAYTLRAPESIKRSAAEQGPAVADFVERLFDGPLPWAKVRQGHKLIRLGQRYTSERLDAACRKALTVDLIDVVQSMRRRAPNARGFGLVCVPEHGIERNVRRAGLSTSSSRRSEPLQEAGGARRSPWKRRRLSACAGHRRSGTDSSSTLLSAMRCSSSLPICQLGRPS